jgi:uncharacterized protein YrrD
MKKSVDMLGLPIISITEGKELGTSKSLVVDAANGIVTALIIEDEDWYRGVKILPYTSVIAIGDDAITITSSESILSVAEGHEYEPLLTANIKVIGTKAITKAGSIHGIVSEIVIDDNGRIASCEIQTPEGDINEVSSEQVSVFGKQVTVIDSEVPAKEILPAQKVAKPAAAPLPKAEPPKAEPPKAEPPKAEPPKAEEKPAAPAPAAPAKEADKSADEKHRRYLLGKKATRRIATDSGVVIVEAGADITEEVLQKAKLANKFVELSMNIQ